ncbi:MAG: hypothetical protein IJF76_04660 [Clostridia bacterium]|nr:hypothetical protein [Clostridia bacterium]
MIIFSLFCSVFINPDLILPTMLSGVEKGISLAFSLLAVYVLWSGIIALLDNSGLSKKIAKLLSPITRKLFKGESEQTHAYISMNFSANLLGAGGAATPLGIKAVESMRRQGNTPTLSMILFTVINTTSIQLLPTTIISLRAQAGSSTPYDTVIPTIIVSVLTTIIGVLAVFCTRKKAF